MSLPAMSFGDRFCFSRKGGHRKVGGCIRRMQTGWPSLGSALETPWMAVGGPLLSFYAGMLKASSPCAKKLWSYSRLRMYVYHIYDIIIRIMETVQLPTWVMWVLTGNGKFIWSGLMGQVAKETCLQRRNGGRLGELTSE